MKKIEIKKSLKDAWKITKDNIWFLVAVELCAYLLNFVGSMANIGFVVSTITGIVVLGLFLRLSRGEETNFQNIFVGITGNKILNYFIATIIVSFFIVIGMVLLIVPGIIIALMTCFVGFIILDQKKDFTWKDKVFWTSIKESKRITSGFKWQIFKFFLLVILINLLGVIALGIGLLVTLPLTGIALALIYNQLKNNTAEPESQNSNFSLPDSSEPK